MAQNNLRVVYNNIADAATIVASSAVIPATNLKSNIKSLPWRSSTSSTTNIYANLTLAFSQAITLDSVILAFTNLSSQTTVRVRGYVGGTPTLGGTVDVPTVTPVGTTVFDTGFVQPSPPQTLGNWDFGVTPLGVHTESVYAPIWIPQASVKPCTSISIEIHDPFNTNQYVQIGRLIVGTYWSPKYNTSFGVTAKFKDDSVAERTEAGDNIISNHSSYSGLTFDLKHMTDADKATFRSMLKTNSIKLPIFVSTFPEDEDTDKEQAFQIYGRFIEPPGISNHIFNMYNTSVELEEI